MLKYVLSGRRLALTLLVVVTGVVLCSLGIWQVRRMNERLMGIEYIKSRMADPSIVLDPGQSIDPVALDYRRVQVRGTFDASDEIVLRNRSVDGATGFHLITPLRLSGSDKAILVDRGWIPYDEATPEKRSAFPPPEGEITFEGIARMSQEATTTPVDPPLAEGQARLDAWFRVNIPRIQQQVDLPLLPVFVEQQPERPGPQSPPIKVATSPPSPGNHMSYAVQWFSFAVILFGGYFAIMYQQWKQSQGVPQRTTDVARQQV